MKICFISNLYPPYVLGGAEIVASRFAEALAGRGHEVFVITTSPNRKQIEETINKVKVYRINPFNLYPVYQHPNKPSFLKPFWHLLDLWNPHAYTLTKKILDKEKPDIIHIHNYKGLSLSIFDAAKKTKKPVVFTAHDCSLICPRANLLNGKGLACTKPDFLCKNYVSAQKFLFDKKVDAIISPSLFTLALLKEKGFLSDTKTIRIPNPIDLHGETKPKNQDIIKVLYVGAISKHKGIEDLITAFKEIKDEKIRLDIVGAGPQTDSLKKTTFKDKRIVFCGYKQKEELGKYYSQANLLVMPSICIENSPSVIYEAFRYGTPVLASRIGGIPELIEENVNGILFEAGNTKDLKEKLESLLKDANKLEKLSREAHKSAKKYDIEETIKQLEELYRSESVRHEK